MNLKKPCFSYLCVMDAEINKKIIELLLPLKPKQISVFGSYARGEMNKNSDIDIMVDLDENVSMLDVGGIYMELKRILKRNIDLVTKGGLNPIFKPYIEKDLIEIYRAK